MVFLVIKKFSLKSHVLSFTGQRFALREGGRTVGAGVVSKVLSWGGRYCKPWSLKSLSIRIAKVCQTIFLKILDKMAPFDIIYWVGVDELLVLGTWEIIRMLC